MNENLRRSAKVLGVGSIHGNLRHWARGEPSYCTKDLRRARVESVKHSTALDTTLWHIVLGTAWTSDPQIIS